MPKTTAAATPATTLGQNVYTMYGYGGCTGGLFAQTSSVKTHKVQILSLTRIAASYLQLASGSHVSLLCTSAY